MQAKPTMMIMVCGSPLKTSAWGSGEAAPVGWSRFSWLSSAGAQSRSSLWAQPLPLLLVSTPPLVITLSTIRPLDGTMSPASHRGRTNLSRQALTQPTQQPHSHGPPCGLPGFFSSLWVFIKLKSSLNARFVLSSSPALPNRNIRQATFLIFK